MFPIGTDFSLAPLSNLFAGVVGTVMWIAWSLFGGTRL